MHLMDNGQIFIEFDYKFSDYKFSNQTKKKKKSNIKNSPKTSGGTEIFKLIIFFLLQAVKKWNLSAFFEVSEWA